MKRPAILGMTGAVVALVALSGSVMAAGRSSRTAASRPGTTSRPSRDRTTTRLATGSTAIAGWTVTKGNVDWTDGHWQAAEGSKSIDLDGAEDTAGAISQTFDTVVNGTYVVTFSMSGNPGNPAVSPIKTMRSTPPARRSLHLRHRHEGTTFADMKWATPDLHVPGEEHPDHADLHQHDRQRLGPRDRQRRHHPDPRDRRRLQEERLADHGRQDRHLVPEPGRLRQLLRDRREEPRQLVGSGSQPR